MSSENVKMSLVDLGRRLAPGVHLDDTRNAYRAMLRNADPRDVISTLERQMAGHKERGFVTLIRLGLEGKLGGQPPCWDVNSEGNLFYKVEAND